MFSGSYDPADVIFLLKPVRVEPTPVAEKERLIQSGQRHYSEMIGPEKPPTPRYLDIFYQALEQNRERFARDLQVLAHQIAADRAGPVTLVSLARAGTPIGALVGRILRQQGRQAVHYSISIIRDRGIDANALRYILERHSPDSVVFVDGWTGKGIIAQELRRLRFQTPPGDAYPRGSPSRHASRHTAAGPSAVRRRALPSVHSQAESGDEPGSLDLGLYVVTDLCGAARFAATSEDYLIPSSVLGCTVSGLVSRSILNADVVGPGDFHGCVFYEDMKEHDLSRWFLDQVVAGGPLPPGTDHLERPSLSPAADASLLPRRRSAAFLADMTHRFGIRDVHRIKPGIGEATRVLLRRVPGRLLLRDPGRPEVAHLLLLAREKGVPVVIEPTLPYCAAALIQEVDG